MHSAKNRFKVALSFPGEHRSLVGQVAEILVTELGLQRVFYDRFFAAELARPNLDTYLQEIYGKESDLVVVFVCDDYDAKSWCGLEWRAIRGLIKDGKDEQVMLVRVQEGDVKGLLPIDGYVSTQGRNASEVAKLILERVDMLSECVPAAATVPTRGQPQSTDSGVCIPDTSAWTLGQIPTPSYPELYVGREASRVLLDEAWNGDVAVLQIVAPGGVGKTTLVWQWLQQLRAERPDDLHSAIDWSFYSQGQHEYVTDSRRFFALAVEHYSRFGLQLNEYQLRNDQVVARAVGEIFVRVGGVLVLDGLEPLQELPACGGHIRDLAVSALIRFLTSSAPPQQPDRKRLLIVTTRWEAPEIAGRTSKVVSLATLSDEEGAELLSRFRLGRAPDERLKVPGIVDPDVIQAELCAASQEYGGHPLALVLLASFLLRLRGGDLRQRRFVASVSKESQGDPHRHARRIMSSYDTLLVEEKSENARGARQILFLLGLFDRPAPVDLLKVLLRKPPIGNLTHCLSEEASRIAVDHLTHLRLAHQYFDTKGEHISAHPLVREHFRRLIISEMPSEYREAHSRLFEYLSQQAPEQPDSLEGMQPLFLAMIHGCKAGRFQDVLHSVYYPRVMRGDQMFAAHRLGAEVQLVTVLSHFFQRGSWSRLAGESGSPDQALDLIDASRVLIHSGIFLTETVGYSTPAVQEAFDEALPISRLAKSPRLSFNALSGLWRYRMMRGEVRVGTSIGESLHCIAGEIDSDAYKIMAQAALVTNRFFSGEFDSAINRSERSAQLLAKSERPVGDTHETGAHAVRFVVDPTVRIQMYFALAFWHLGDARASSRCERFAMKRARELKHDHTLSVAYYLSWWHRQYFRDFEGCFQIASEMLDFCCDRGLSFWVEVARLQLAWSEAIREPRGIDAMLEAISRWGETRATLKVPYWSSLFATACLETERVNHNIERKLVGEAIEVADSLGQEVYRPDLHRIEGVFMFRNGRVNQAKAKFEYARSIARRQMSVAMEIRVAGSEAELLADSEGAGTAIRYLNDILGEFEEYREHPEWEAIANQRKLLL